MAEMKCQRGQDIISKTDIYVIEKLGESCDSGKRVAL